MKHFVFILLTWCVCGRIRMYLGSSFWPGVTLKGPKTSSSSSASSSAFFFVFHRFFDTVFTLVIGISQNWKFNGKKQQQDLETLEYFVKESLQWDEMRSLQRLGAAISEILRLGIILLNFSTFPSTASFKFNLPSRASSPPFKGSWWPQSALM